MKARQGKTRLGKKRQGKERQGKGKARKGKAGQRKSRQGKERQGKARQGKTKQGNASHDKAKQRTVLRSILGSAYSGLRRVSFGRAGGGTMGKKRLAGKQSVPPEEVVISDDEDDHGTSLFGLDSWQIIIWTQLCAFMTVASWTAVTQVSATARRQFFQVMYLPISNARAMSNACANALKVRTRQKRHRSGYVTLVGTIATAPSHVVLGLTAWGLHVLKDIGLPNEFYQLLMFMKEHFKSQDLMMVEYFCGEKAVTNAFGDYYGYRKVKGYDYRHDSHNQNLNTGDGFLLALCWLQRVKEALGAVWWGTVCSSWVWLARGHSRRTKQAARGDVSIASIAAGNKMVSRMALLLTLCYAKGLGWALEQPMSSLMVYHPSMLYVIGRVRAMGLSLWQVTTFMGAYNGETVKPHVLYGNEGWLKMLERRRPPASKFKNENVVTKWVNASGKPRCAGGSGLKGTQTYTREFGQAVASAFIDERDNPSLQGHLNTYAEDELDKFHTPCFEEAWQDLDLKEIMDALKDWSQASFK